MNYYIDIQVKPNIEMKLNVLMNAVYGKLHKCLYDLRSTDIGISFPNYNVCLGNLLRLHGIAERLHGLQSGIKYRGDARFAVNCRTGSLENESGFVCSGCFG